jgi:UDP-glucose 4-epimerase
VKIVITGGAGFIGTNLRKRFDADVDQHEIVLLDDLSSGYLENASDLSQLTRFVRGSITDIDLVSSLVSDADAIVHLAARPSVARSIENPAATTHANVDGTLTILEAVRESNPAAHIVYASSSSVYGANQTLPKKEDMATLPISPYAASKLSGEVYALAYQASFGIPVTAFRFFNVYGPYQRPGHSYAAVVPAFLEAAVKKRPLPVHGDGTQTRDFTYVGTLVDAIAAVVTRKLTSPTPINLAFGTRTSLLELIASIEDLIKSPVNVQHQPTRPGDVRDSQASNDSLISLLPDLQAIPLELGLHHTYKWMKTFLANEAT